MKFLISCLIFLSIGNTAFAQEAVDVPQASVITTTVPTTAPSNLDKRVAELEAQIANEANNDRLANRLELFINSLGVFATVMLALFGLIGAVAIVNVYRTENKAKQALKRIQGMFEESKEVHTKLKQVTDGTVEQGDRTIKVLKYIIDQATDKKEKLITMAEEAKTSIDNWERSKKAYVSSPTIGTATFTPPPPDSLLGKLAELEVDEETGLFRMKDFNEK